MKKRSLHKTLTLVLSLTLILGVAAAAAGTVTKTITANYMDIKLVVNGTAVTPKDANGNIVEPFACDGTTYLPVRALANALGQDVEWDGETNTIYIGEIPSQETYSYQSIFEDYKVKIQEAVPGLIEEYKEEAASNEDGLQGLATLCNAKVAKLAAISNDGITEMARFYYKHGSGSYDEYSEWASKLMDIYTAEASKIQEVYMDSAK